MWSEPVATNIAVLLLPVELLPGCVVQKRGADALEHVVEYSWGGGHGESASPEPSISSSRTRFGSQVQ